MISITLTTEISLSEQNINNLTFTELESQKGQSYFEFWKTLLLFEAQNCLVITDIKVNNWIWLNKKVTALFVVYEANCIELYSRKRYGSTLWRNKTTKISGELIQWIHVN